MSSKPKTPMQAQAAFYKRKMIMSRIVGLFCCLLAIGAIIIYYFKTINEWLSVITVAYCVATIFVTNSFLQDIKIGNPWQRINAICGIFLYLVTIFLMIWAFVQGHISTQF